MKGDNPAARRFGQNLRRHRRRLTLTQEQVSRLCHLNRTEIGKLEHGEREPRLMTIVKLAAVLEISSDDLLVGIDWLVAADPTPLGLVLIDGRISHQNPRS